MKGLLRGTVALFLLINAVGLFAQRVTNVTAEQQGQDVVISYVLEADGPVEVDFFVSTDQGKNWQGPLSNCSGDVGKNVLAGASKRIRWAVLQKRELAGNGIRFKVVAHQTTMDRAEVAGRPWLNPSLTYGAVTDIDGNTYATIQIGKQVWMAENLRTTRYRNGDLIMNVTDGVGWSLLTAGAWAHYNNDSQYEQPYGKLYNWYAVGTRSVCPNGWHVPSDGEWTTLSGYLGGESVAGGKLKATTLWNRSSTSATNGNGFSALPGGHRNNSDGNFDSLGYFGSWWSASESGAELAWNRGLGYDNAGVDRSSYGKWYGFCLRCVRD